MIFNGRTPPFPPAFNLARVFSERGVEFTFVNMTEEGDRQDTLLGFGRIVSLKVSPSFLRLKYLRYPVAFVIFFLRLRRLLQAAHPDVLLGCWGGGYLLARMLRMSGIHSRVVYWANEFIMHTELRRTDPLGYVVWAERKLAPTADLTVVADPIRGRYQCAYLGTSNWMAIRNTPSSIEHSSGPSLLKDALVSIKRSNPQSQIFVFVGSICQGALVPQMIESFKWWPELTPLVFVGDVGYDIPDFSQRIASHPRRIHHVPRMAYDHVMRGLQYADVGIAFYNVDKPWINERYCAPCKVGDYLQVGLPMLLSCNETLQGLVNDCPVGIAVDPRSPEAIAHGVGKILSMIAEGEITKDAIRRAFLMELCLERQCQPLLEVFCTWKNATG